jgi:hypothetical protein
MWCQCHQCHSANQHDGQKVNGFELDGRKYYSVLSWMVEDKTPTIVPWLKLDFILGKNLKRHRSCEVQGTAVRVMKCDRRGFMLRCSSTRRHGKLSSGRPRTLQKMSLMLLPPDLGLGWHLGWTSTQPTTGRPTNHTYNNSPK